MQQNIMVVHGGGGGGPLECLPGQGVLGVGEVGEEEEGGGGGGGQTNLTVKVRSVMGRR